MHAPNHLFCSGTFAPALAAAAWAGYLIAQGKHGEAEKWQDVAVTEQGKAWLATPLMKGGQLEVRVIKGEVGVHDLELLIALLQLQVEMRSRADEPKPEAARLVPEEELNNEPAPTEGLYR